MSRTVLFAALALVSCGLPEALGIDLDSREPSVDAGPAAPATVWPVGDYGDAPDGTARAYPGVVGRFPTLSRGPVHHDVTRIALGGGASVEPGLIAPEDALDDGLHLPSTLPHCEPTSLTVTLTVRDVGQTFPDGAYLNVWMDLDRDGAWGSALPCPGTPLTASEWAVRNHLVTLRAPGVYELTLPAFTSWNPDGALDAWVRVTVSDAPAPSADGSGPDGGYALGETEDVLLEAVAARAFPTLTIDPDALTPAAPLPVVSPITVSLPPTTVAPPVGPLREVDVAFLGGSVNTSTPVLLASVAGTGAQARLSSWTVKPGATFPTFLADGPTLQGHSVTLRALTTAVSPELSHQLLLVASVSSGNLWLRTYRVAADGTFTALSTWGYGAVEVHRYDVTHRVLPGSPLRFQVVTPVTRADGRLRLITWEVNGQTGAITGRQDSGNSVLTRPDSIPSAVFLTGEGTVAPHVSVSYPTPSGAIATAAWLVQPDGTPSTLGPASPGTDIRNVNPVVRTTSEDLVTAPVGGSGLVMARMLGTQLQVSTWELINNGCPGAGCAYTRSLIGDDDDDLQPGVPGIQLTAPTPNTQRVMLRDGTHHAELFSRNPDQVQAVASVRKVMVAIVALDAVRAGEVSLDDVVTVSPQAAAVNGTGASVMGLVAGERITLRNLMYGNIMVSAGDATWAISEHVAGTLNNMVTRMNNKAAQLGMSQTFHCQSGTTFSGVAYSTARDQARLWESVADDADFLEFAGGSSQLVCGTRPDDSSICHPLAGGQMTRAMNQYPNLVGAKTGGGGGLCPQLSQFDGVPTCVSQGCLSVQSNRLGRAFVLSELQPSTGTGTRWTDARPLFDFGVRTLFIPERTGGSIGYGSNLTDFGLASLSSQQAVTAFLHGDTSLFVCLHAVDVTGGTTSRSGCLSRSLSLTLSHQRADADVLLGEVKGGALELGLYRVGRREP